MSDLNATAEDERKAMSETLPIQRPRVTIYTDGACKGNPGRGGWGAWLTTEGHEKELFGGEQSFS